MLNLSPINDVGVSRPGMLLLFSGEFSFLCI